MDDYSNFAILAQFNKGIFSPEVSVNKSFKELQDEKLQGTVYEEYRNDTTDDYKGYIYPDPHTALSSTLETIIFSIGLIFIILLVYLISRIIFLKTSRNKKCTTILDDYFRKEYKNLAYSRKLPFDNSMFATYARLKSLKKLNNECMVIGVYLLKWIQNHNVELVKVETKRFFKAKLEDTIKLKSLPDDAEPLEKEFFDLMRGASNDDDILKQKDFKRWCEKIWIPSKNGLKDTTKKDLTH